MYEEYPAYDHEGTGRFGRRKQVLMVVIMAAVAVMAIGIMVLVGLRDTPAAGGDDGTGSVEDVGEPPGDGGGPSREGFNPAVAGADIQERSREQAEGSRSDVGNEVFVSPGERGYEKEAHELERINGGGEPRPGGVGNEPGGYDPLGKNPSPGDVTETQKQRARLAAARFVVAVYAYSGEYADEYAQGVAGCVAWPDFYSSRGGEQIQDYIAAVRQRGVTQAAVLDRFEIIGGGTGKPQGYAYFATGQSYNRYGEIQGERREYRQRLTLASDGSQYQVQSASAREGTGSGP